MEPELTEHEMEAVRKIFTRKLPELPELRKLLVEKMDEREIEIKVLMCHAYRQGRKNGKR